MRARLDFSSLALAVAVVVVAAGSGVLVAPSVAWAAGGDEAAADAAIRRGVDLRKQGRDVDALEEFRRGYAIAKTPRALAQIALAEQALGRWVDAESDLDEAMASKTDAWIRKNVATLNGALDVIRRHLGSLEVIGPAGAALRVDSRAAGTLPLAKAVRVPIGNLTIELRKPGFFPVSRPVSIAVGELTRESMDLQPVDAPPPPPTPPIVERPPLPPIVEPPPPPPHVAEERTWQRPLALGVAAGAILGAAGGGVALWIRNGAVSDANKLTCNIDDATMSVNPANPGDGARCRDLASQASHAKLAALISFSAAGALAVTAAVLFLTAPSGGDSPPGRSSAHVLCAPTLAASGVECAFRF